MEKVGKFSESLAKSTRIFQLLGFQLFSIEDGLKSGSKISRKHQASLLFILFMLCLDICGIAFAIHFDLQNQQSDNVTKSLAFQFVSFIGITLATVVAFVNAFYRREKLKEIFRSFEKVSKIFVREIGTSLNYSKFERNFNSTLISIASTYIVLSISVLCFVLYFNHSNVILWTVLSVTAYFFTALNFSFFIFFIVLLRENLIFMRNELENLLNIHKMSKSSVVVVSNRRNCGIGTTDLFEKALKLKKIYSTLCDTTGAINDFFGLPILVKFVILIVTNISSGYKVKMIDNSSDRFSFDR
jgi:hypothetical protein